MVAVCGLAAALASGVPWPAHLTSAVQAAVRRPIISQRGKFFTPPEVSFPLGSTLRVDNDDNVAHSVLLTSPDGQTTNLGTQPPGVPTDIVLDKLGDYMARCGIHPRMKLLVHVR